MRIVKVLVILLIFISTLNCRDKSTSYIFLITLDTTRADVIDHSPSGNNNTPNLALLSSKGVNFRNCYSVIPITLPSHASMFYSQYPHDIKLYNNGQINNSKYTSLPQLLKKNGFRTGAVISLGVLKSDFGLNRGFDEYIENFTPSVWTRSAEEVNRDLFPMIIRMKGERSFIWAHYSDPHEPYYPPYFDGIFEIWAGNNNILRIKNNLYPLLKKVIPVDPGKTTLKFKTKISSQIENNTEYNISGISYSDLEFRPEDPDTIDIILPESWRKEGDDYFTSERESLITLINKSNKTVNLKISFLYTVKEDNKSKKPLYNESVRYMDSHIGRLINFLREEEILNRSVIIVMGDHGEGFGEYMGNFGHIHYLNKSYSHVPFIIYGNGIEEGEIRSDLVSNLNIAPTILDIAGIKKPGFMQGSSVLIPSGDNKLILETFSPEAYFDAFSVIEFPDQIIFYPGRTDNRIEYIDLENDLLGTNTDNKNVSADERARLLRSILKISRTITATKGKIGKRKRIHEDILKSLGYL